MRNTDSDISMGGSLASPNGCKNRIIFVFASVSFNSFPAKGFALATAGVVPSMNFRSDFTDELVQKLRCNGQTAFGMVIEKIDNARECVSIVFHVVKCVGCGNWGSFCILVNHIDGVGHFGIFLICDY